jgi:hypothetical protein
MPFASVIMDYDGGCWVGVYGCANFFRFDGTTKLTAERDKEEHITNPHSHFFQWRCKKKK